MSCEQELGVFPERLWSADGVGHWDRSLPQASLLAVRIFKWVCLCPVSLWPSPPGTRCIVAFKLATLPWLWWQSGVLQCCAGYTASTPQIL